MVGCLVAVEQPTQNSPCVISDAWVGGHKKRLSKLSYNLILSPMILLLEQHRHTLETASCEALPGLRFRAGPQLEVYEDIPFRLRQDSTALQFV